MTKLPSTYPIALTFDQHPITVLTDEAGAPWWVADEVCAALGIDKHRDAVARLDDDERGSAVVDTPGGPQRKATINESGLYSLILRSRKPEAKRFKKWVTSEVLPAIRKTGTYGSSTLATREADLSALTDAVSAIVPALTAITTTLIASLEARVAALEARPTAPADKAKAYFDQLRADNAAKNPEAALRKLVASGLKGRPSYRTARGRYLAFDFDAVERLVGRPAISAWASKDWLVRDQPHFTKKVMIQGERTRMLCIKEEAFEALPRPAQVPALPAPRKDGVHPLRVGRVRIKDGVPFEVYSGPLVAEDQLAKVEAAFGAAFPGWHLGRDWRSARGWGYDWSRNTWVDGYEPPPADAGLVARARRVGVVDQPARVIDDEDGEPVAVEWKGQRSPRELESMSAELRRLRYSAGPWKRVPGGWRAELH